MRHLYLLRHAKSSWDDPRRPDHERPLAPRGIRDAERLARHLAAVTPRPDLLFCSSALRARQTLEPIAQSLRGAPVKIEDALYLAAWTDLLDRIHLVPGRDRAVLLVGHNPGMEELARQLAGAGPAALRQRLAEKFPTGALATLAVPFGSWRSLRPGAAELAELVVPRQLG